MFSRSEDETDIRARSLRMQIRRPISRCLGGYFTVCRGNVGGSYGLSLKAATVLSNSSVTAFR